MSMKELKRRLADFERDDLLGLIGLEERRSAGDKVLPGLALFGAGLLVGVGLGLMLAPKPGSALRDDVKQRFGKGHEPKAEPKAAEATRVV